MLQKHRTYQLAAILFLGLAQCTIASEPRSFPYVLKYAWFDAHPIQHPEIHDTVVELQQPLSASTRTVATIAYSYPKNRRIAFEFAWDRPPRVIEMLEGRVSQPYAVPLAVQRRIGSEFVDEFAAISLSSGGHSVDVNVADVCKRLRVDRISAETYAEPTAVGFREQNKQTAAQEGTGRFTLSGAWPNEDGALAPDMRYAYLKVEIQARGGYGFAYYVYENAVAGNTVDDGSDVEHVLGRPEASVELISISSDSGIATSAASARPLVNEDFERGLSAPWGTGQYSAGKPAWWNSRDCDSSANPDQSQSHGGGASLHIINRSPRAAHVYGTTERPLGLEPGKRYRISVWARARELRSQGAVSIIVDDDWKVRPIQLPAGTYDWNEFQGTFLADNANGQLRILSEDAGEVWLDDIHIASE